MEFTDSLFVHTSVIPFLPHLLRSTRLDSHDMYHQIEPYMKGITQFKSRSQRLKPYMIPVLNADGSTMATSSQRDGLEETAQRNNVGRRLRGSGVDSADTSTYSTRG